ncbi:phosphoglyceromutase [Aquirufa antheringensis]|uniref:phosphoglyceromutase n=1 Tax=Aquirufa antheringensis TaxID=2516559 RepID=UPI001F89CA54|nr:phosphoglyceromutase [Aquirufa antheringensis]MCE4217696.1 phosphoglyceromutase [Pseudarcicella sp. GAP-15]MCZ2477631.1 phosphoglyceromutase [Aquirufa antheringensis]
MNKLHTLLFLLFAVSITASAQKDPDARVIVITTDGYRWQELFNGIDTSLVKMKRFHHGDSARLIAQYWSPSLQERRKKLMPFFWGKLAASGQLHGNRKEGSQVDNANPYWFSYPGYSEILTGQVDTSVNSNEYKPNPNTNFFEYLNSLPAYKGKVAAFGAWDAFDRIMNEKRAGFPVVNAFDSYPELEKDPETQLIAKMLKESFKPFGMAESIDVFTHFKAMHYLKKNKPKALYISYGETDEFAHEGAYNHYLDAAHQFDAWVGEIWDFVNTDPDYKGKTTLLITTDHGRGDAIKTQWTSHGERVKDCYQIWYAMIGANVPAFGEVKTAEKVYQKDLIHKAAKAIGVSFKSGVK